MSKILHYRTRCAHTNCNSIISSAIVNVYCIWIWWCYVHVAADAVSSFLPRDVRSANKKGQLSLTNPRDACKTFARFM